MLSRYDIHLIKVEKTFKHNCFSVKKPAFALVLALALMGFMVLLVVTLATMVQMQMRMSVQSLNNFKARQAAKFAAYEAMGNIQSSLGPDQRVTSNAKVFDDTVNTEITKLDSQSGTFDWWTSPMGITRAEADRIDNAAISQNRHWLGVWNSKLGYAPSKQLRSQSRNDYVTSTVKKATTWLVSGNGIASEDDILNKGESESIKYLPTSTLESGKYVRVVSSGSVMKTDGSHEATTEDVLAPVVTLTQDANAVTGEVTNDSKETRIAWWVSDENQKASLNAIAPYDFKKHAEAIKYRQQSLPFYSGAQGLTLGADGDKLYDLEVSSDDGEETSGLTRARNASSIKAFDVIKSGSVPDNIVPSKVLFFSASCDTKGLLVNVKFGGLKKDLSLGLLRTDRGNEPTEITEKETDDIPSYFPRPYGVAGFYTKTTAYPIIYCKGVQWATYRRQNKPKLLGVKYDGGTRFSGHIFGPQQYEREDEVTKFKDMSAISSVSEFAELYGDRNIWKDPGGPLWDQLRSYYNFRAPDEADITLNDRVQTDDRFGAKPVVRRFQVYFVPTFTNYGGSKYGLRLHIIPLMVLWNPYDTKIGGESYYAIRVMGFPYPMFTSAIGTFRFAIGYEADGGKIFQCVRDLRTERMPAFYGDFTNKTKDTYLYTNMYYLRQFCFSLTQYNTPDYRPPTVGNIRFDDAYAYSTYGDLTSSGYLANMRCFYSGFYTNSQVASGLGETTNGWNSIPMGYGELAPNSFSKGSKNTKYGYGSLLSIYGNLGSINESFPWITDETNMVPNFDTLKTFRAYEVAAKNDTRFAKRVAKIPLFLNNLYASVAHGTNLPGLKGYKLFKAQMPIDCVTMNLNDESIMTDGSGESNGVSTRTGDAELHFLAYDPTGIEAGKSKIFAMESIVNYLGDFTNSNRTNSYTDVMGGDGPNGYIEGENKNQLYTRKKALMKPLGEGGELGNCFYLDVPHPEVEHQAKWTDNVPYDKSGMSNSYANNANPFILFDIDDLRQNTTDMSGRSPPASINDYYIDMQDLVGFNFRFIHPHWSHTPYFMSLSATPFGYGLYNAMGNTSNTQTDCKYPPIFNSSTDGEAQRYPQRYLDLNLDIWIYKKEGLTFSKINPFATTEDAHTYSSNYMPLLVSMTGVRVFSGDKFQSFPDPTLRRQKFRWGSDIVNNYATQGMACRGGTNGYKISSSVSLKPIMFFNNSNLQKCFPQNVAAEDALIGFNKTASANSFNAEQNARYYINWLPINPRRHTANSWPAFDDKPRSTGSAGMSDKIGDLPPHMVRRNFAINNSDRMSGNYASRLNNACENIEGFVPYGFLFALPFGTSDSSDIIGSQPFMNRRLFVNGTLLTTYYDSDLNAQELTEGSDSDSYRYTWQFGILTKNIISTNQIYSDGDVGVGGFTSLGYKIPGPSDDEVYLGLSAKNGTTQLALHHILRETEVVSNVANLSAANLNFGAGKAAVECDNREGGTPSYLFGEKNEHYPIWAMWGLRYPESLIVSMAIGNSLCPSRVCPERSYQISWIDGSCALNYYHNINASPGTLDGKRDTSWVEDKSVVYDYSWHFNEALWDEYYFSTFPYRKDEAEVAYKDSVGYTYPQNPRMRYCVSSADYLKQDNLMFDAEKSDAQFDENASKIWVDGAFNVNSTDVDAWKAVLSTYYGQTIESYEGGESSNKNTAPFHRWAAPLKNTAVTAQNANIHDEDSMMNGFRALDDEEIESLAVSIVEHVKDRGPFYSMSDFVNRAVGNNSAEDRYADKKGDNLLDYTSQARPLDRQNLQNEITSGGTSYRVGHMQKGALQAAIDATGINNAYHQDFILDSTNNVSSAASGNEIFDRFSDPKKTWENWRGAIGPQATGAPAYLMQQDILSRLGSFLTVRSDTFKIRAYGEVRNPVSGIVEGKAWCEMVVQRVPEYIDSASNKATDVSGREKELGYQDENQGDMARYNTVYDESNGGLTGLNKALGRRFKIVSFRWLNDNEI